MKPLRESARAFLLPVGYLESLLKSSARQKTPVEMLTLSACQTAEGDDRAPLGLSGMALRAYAQSAGRGADINDQHRRGAGVHRQRRNGGPGGERPIASAKPG
ncbi:hypothetical protein [Methylomagnum sp.]